MNIDKMATRIAREFPEYFSVSREIPFVEYGPMLIYGRYGSEILKSTAFIIWAIMSTDKLTREIYFKRYSLEGEKRPTPEILVEDMCKSISNPDDGFLPLNIEKKEELNKLLAELEKQAWEKYNSSKKEESTE